MPTARRDVLKGLTASLAGSALLPAAPALAAAPREAVARKLLTGVKTAKPTPIMASPPTIVAKPDWAGSTISGIYRGEMQPMFRPDSPLFRQVSGLINPMPRDLTAFTAGYISHDTGAGPLSGFSNGWGLAFQFTGYGFDFALNGYYYGGPKRFRLRVNGQWAQAEDSVSPTQQVAVVQVTFPRPVKDALIEIYFGEAIYLHGFNVDPKARIAPPPVDPAEIHAVMLGDSYTQGYNGRTRRSGLPHRLGEALGVRNLVASGVGSQGWVAAQAGRTQLDRIQSGDLDRFGPLDLIILYGSVNDWRAPEPAIKAQVTRGMQAASSRHPDAIKLFLSSFSADGAVVSPSRNAAARDGALAGADDRTVVLDLFALGLPRIHGDGTGDTTHPGEDECHALAQVIAKAFADRLTAMA